MSVRRPMSASDAPTLIVVVVFPTPPFWFAIAITLGRVLAERDSVGEFGVSLMVTTSCLFGWPQTSIPVVFHVKPSIGASGVVFHVKPQGTCVSLCGPECELVVVRQADCGCTL